MTGSDATGSATLPPEGAARSDTGAARKRGSEGMLEATRGTIIGRYVVLAKLGSGGMGVVLVVYDPELDRKVALELLRFVDEHGRHSARLQLEAQALARRYRFARRAEGTTWAELAAVAISHAADPLGLLEASALPGRLGSTPVEVTDREAADVVICGPRCRCAWYGICERGRPMQTSAKSIAIVLALAPALPGCALFGIKQQRDQQAAYEEQVKQQQAQAAVQMKEAERQVKIAEARTAYLEKELDAQQYAVACEALAAEVEKVIVKMGRSVMDHGSGMLVTDWSYVQAKYEETYDYRIRQTRAASKSRYVAELVPASDGAACKVKASFQYSDDNGSEMSDRALDLEARVLEQVEPERYAEIEAEFKAIEQRHPAG